MPSRDTINEINKNSSILISLKSYIMKLYAGNNLYVVEGGKELVKNSTKISIIP